MSIEFLAWILVGLPSFILGWYIRDWHRGGDDRVDD